MSETLPPAASTARTPRRLRAAAAALAVVAFASTTLFPAKPARAKDVPPKVLLGASVSDSATASMSPALWTKMVSDFIGGTVVAFPDGMPSVDDCRKASADYLVDAPFDLRPQLPGIPYASDRVSAQTHLTVVNCFTSAVLYDRTINFESDPRTDQPAGDFDTVPEISWSKNVAAALRKVSIAFPRIARVVNVDSPFAFVDIPAANVRQGQALRDFARADRSALAPPIVLTVIALGGRYVQVQFSTLPGAAQPEKGDLLEAVPPGEPAVLETPSVIFTSLPSKAPASPSAAPATAEPAPSAAPPAASPATTPTAASASSAPSSPASSPHP